MNPDIARRISFVVFLSACVWYQLALDDMVTEIESFGKTLFVCGIHRQSDEVKTIVENTKVMTRYFLNSVHYACCHLH
jgi:hypothetical protein